MASMCNQWQKVDRSDGVQEYFMNGKLITSDTWTLRNPPDFYGKNHSKLNYPYQKDWFKFRGNIYGSDINNKIKVTEITHATSYKRAVSIIKDGGFRPGTKRIPGIGESNLIWFGLKVEEEQIDSLRMNYKQCAYDELRDEHSWNVAKIADEVASEFANTTPFQPMSRYGNVTFTLCISEVLSQYQRQFCVNGDVICQPEMRKLGTFAYKMEIMHVILVCPPCMPSVNNFPILHNDADDPIIILPDGTCTWRPHSTGNQIIEVTKNGKFFKTFKRWEHVTFAFVVPEGSRLQIPSLHYHASLCIHLTIKYENIYIIYIKEAICNILDLISHEENSDNRTTLANMLIVMIDGYHKDLPLYQKTVNICIKDLTVQDEWVKEKFKEKLPEEFKKLDWSPFLARFLSFLELVSQYGLYMSTHSRKKR